MTGEPQREVLTAKDMIAMLRRHYLPEGRPPAGIFAPEIQAPGSSGRRADLIWQGCASANGRELVGHEVKVTRADLLAELADVSKSDPWQRYCDRWWLVVPDLSLVAGLELPPTWGVLTPPSGRRTRSMTVAVPAPKLKPEEQAPALYTLATWLHWRHHKALTEIEGMQRHVRQLQDTNQSLREQLPRDAERTQGQKRLDQEIVEQILSELGGARSDGDIGDWEARVSVDDVIAALRDLGEAKRRQVAAERAVGLNKTRLRSLKSDVEHALQRFAEEAA